MTRVTEHLSLTLFPHALMTSKVVILGTLLLGAITAHAENETSDNAELTSLAKPINSFSADYFKQYAPRTALDMVKNVPGFQLRGGNSNRGLGQGGANVLLNGEIITGKGNDSFNQIDRIAASNVERIEILDGAQLNIPGLAGDIANVVTKPGAFSGTWEWTPQWRSDVEANLLSGKMTVSGEKGALAYTAELYSDSFRQGYKGQEERFGPDGILYQSSRDKRRYYGDQPGAAINLTWKPRADHIGNLNATYNLFNFNRSELSIITAETDEGFDGQSLYSLSEDEWNAKLDGNYEFPAGPGKLKLIGYYRAEHSPVQSRYDLYDTVQEIEKTRYFETADEGEAIAKAEYSWQTGEGKSWQGSLEGAYNFLDTESRYQDLLDNSNSAIYDPVSVEENRAEANITHTRAFGSNWDVQASLGVEYSQITQGDLVRDFIRPKGFLNATYKVSPKFNIRGRIERQVGQLNFFNFIDSIDLQDDLNRVGNSDLVPDQRWKAELQFDREFEGGHVLKIRPYASLISDLVDRIPIGEDGDGVGNIDKAYQYGVELNATLRSEPFGVEGIQIDTKLDLKDSSVKDPVEGFDRHLNSDLIYLFDFDLRYDLPNSNWAIGMGAFDDKRAKVYRLSVVDNNRIEGMFFSSYIEQKDFYGLKIRFALRNLFSTYEVFDRTIYTARRDIGTIESIRHTRFKNKPFLNVAVSGTF